MLAAKWLHAGMLIAVVGFATVTRAQSGHDAQAPLALGTYQQPDGAITVFADGLSVEPYFATRALLAAHELGLDVQPAARRFIDWQEKQFGVSPRLAHYCREAGTNWRTCGAADADDAALALWIELLYVNAGHSGMSAGQARSADSAESALERLLDARSGVYHVSSVLPVSLYMDNVEIARAFEGIAAAADAAGAHAAALRFRRRSAARRRAIDRVFWDHTLGAYRITTQVRPAQPRAFYPEMVAEGYAAFFGYGSPATAPAALFARWMHQHRDVWLGGRDREYPWGLIALAAWRYGDRATVECWLGTAMSLRRGPRWNVLEEAVFQGLMPTVGQGDAVRACQPSGRL